MEKAKAKKEMFQLKCWECGKHFKRSLSGKRYGFAGITCPQCKSIDVEMV